MVETFNFESKEVYTVSIEFRTSILTSHNGKEQRNSLAQYPTKVFALKFAKNKANVEAIEAFIKTIGGRHQQFNWSPKIKHSSQTPRTYLCRLADDSIQQKINHTGYNTFSLAFETIDTNPYTGSSQLVWGQTNYSEGTWAGGDLSVFNQAYSFAYETSLKHNTIIDNLITANRAVNKAWANPKRTWNLEFKKNPDSKRILEEFFLDKKGKWRAFEFEWAANKGGDGNIYNVRFDTDKLDFIDNYLGYSSTTLPIIEVF